MTKNIDSWRTNGADEASIRDSFGLVAKKQKNGNWFKRIDLGEHLGEIVGKCLIEIGSSDLAVKLSELEKWAYGS
jgi:hypothetical protein